MSSAEMVLRRGELHRLPARYRLAGAVGCVCALVLLRLPLSVSLRSVALARRCTGRVALPEEAELAVHAVRSAGRSFPCRFACLESALAATFACLLLRRRVDWCVGARMMPYAAHSWVEVGGGPVGEPGFADHPYLVLIRT